MKEKHVFQWHITHKCNLRCKHCYQEDFNQDLNIDSLENIFYQYLDYLKEFNCIGHINFTGGEPFLTENIWKLIDLCEKYNITFGILTNGTLITKNIALRLKKYKNLKFIQISIDGTKKIHDEIRGKGNFKKAINGLKLIKKYTKVQTMVSFTCHKLNYKNLKKVIRLIRFYGIDRFWSDRIIPTSEELKELALSNDEYKEVIKTLTKENKNNLRTYVHCNRSLQFLEGNNTIYHCSAGTTLFAILANGDILPCRRLPISFGNVLNDSIINLYKNSELINELKEDKIPTECKSCLKSFYCKGGAKCMSYAMYGDYNKKDINCYL